METQVLIPQEFSLVLTAPGGKRSKEQVASVFASVNIPKGTLLHPFQGTLRMDKLEIYSHLDISDIRHRFGLYDEITLTDKKKVRHCNWIRFLKVKESFGSQVNVVGTKIKGGEVVYEVVKTIPMNQEIIVFYIPEKPEELFFSQLRSTIYRQTMDSILEDSPLDLSVSLLSQVLLPISPDISPDLKKFPSKTFSEDEQLSLQSCYASSGDLEDTSIASETTPKCRSTRGQRHLLPCEVCGKTFDRPSLLKRHSRTHTGEKPHICNVCEKGFSTSSSLNTHRRIHSGEKPHECNVCGKCFTASSNLYYHRLTHVKEKPHKCNLCAKSFPTPGDLRSHMYVHNGSWPFKCQICSRGFSKQTNLKNHLFLHTGDKPHACNICLKKFALSCNLRAHMKTHEGETEECARCQTLFLATTGDFNLGLCRKCGRKPIPSDDQENEERTALN